MLKQVREYLKSPAFIVGGFIMLSWMNFSCSESLRIPEDKAQFLAGGIKKLILYFSVL